MLVQLVLTCLCFCLLWQCLASFDIAMSPCFAHRDLDASMHTEVAAPPVGIDCRTQHEHPQTRTQASTQNGVSHGDSNSGLAPPRKAKAQTKQRAAKLITPYRKSKLRMKQIVQSTKLRYPAVLSKEERISCSTARSGISTTGCQPAGGMRWTARWVGQSCSVVFCRLRCLVSASTCASVP